MNIKVSYKTFTNEFGICLEKLMTRAYSKISNSPALNPILQKFHKMIFEIIFSKKRWAEFWFYVVRVLLKVH